MKIEPVSDSETLRRYELMARLGRDSVLFLRRDDGRILEANAAAVAAYGYDRDELLALSVYDLHSPEANALTAAQHAQADARGLLFETVHRRKDGSTFPVEVSTQGAMVGTTPMRMSIIRDITERKRAEEELRGAKQRLESLLENSPLAVIEWSSDDYRIVRWSDEATKVFGWTAEETVGKRIDELNWVYAEDWPLVEQVMGEMLSGKCPRNVNKNRNVRKDGSVIHCEWYNSTLHEPSGKFSVLSLVLDVTERKHAEEALEETDRQKTRFLAVLSHELRNPLTPITNSLFILDRVVPGGEQANRARAVIERQVSQLTRLVDDLLDVTRIVSGKLRLQPARFDIAKMAVRTADDHRAEFAGAGIDFNVRVSCEPIWMDGDETRMAQALGNLLANSIKFTAYGGRVVLALEVDPATTMGVIRVQDTGAGVHADLLPKLFEPFVQADSSLDRSRGGLGLGLALVKSVIELHGGSVEARSDGLGKGTEFVIRVPIDAQAVLLLDADGHPSSRPPSRRVLIIEDNVDAADSLKEALELGAHQVEVAYNGPDGIAKAKEFKPDVLLCDIGLPGMSGYELAKAFRADEKLGSTYLVALTGYAQPEDLQRATESGFDGHVGKPPSLDKLEEVMRALPVRSPDRTKSTLS